MSDKHDDPAFARPALHSPKTALPLFADQVCAGFPSPATDFSERTLDLNDHFVKRPAATYFVRVEGDSMVDAAILHDDILIIDRSLTACHGDIIVAGFHGELTVKELQTRPSVRLLPHNSKYAPIEIPEGADLDIFGVVIGVTRKIPKK